ncbi:MAG: hypothetical protein J7J79_01355 [Thermoplasmata archaeon]|nr:hypothetical protein [Thermoplasmata archaeon]
MEKFEEITKKGVQIYNRYRSPKFRAELLGLEGRKIRVKFEGPFCRTCCFWDWVEDYAYFLEELGLGWGSPRTWRWGRRKDRGVRGGGG